MSNFSQLTQVVDNETGQILYSYVKNENFSNKVVKYEVDKMLKENKIESLDSSLLYRWCRTINAINNRGQVQTFGTKLNNEVELKLLNEGIVCVYVLKCIHMAHPFTHILLKNKKIPISTWKELWQMIGCTNIAMQQRVKKFLEDNGLVKSVKIKNNDSKNENLFVLNPFLYKNSSHTGQFACVVWQEYAIPNVNINFYAYMWLISQDCIIIEEDTDYQKLVENFFVDKSKKTIDK